MKPQVQNERELEERLRERCGRCGCPLSQHVPTSKNHCTGCFHCTGFKSGGDQMKFTNLPEPPQAA